MKGKLLFNGCEEAEIAVGDSLHPPCEREGIPFACTEGICGTCLINVRSGMEHLNPRTQEELDFLGEIETPERLACQCRLVSPGTVEIEY